MDTMAVHDMPARRVIRHEIDAVRSTWIWLVAVGIVAIGSRLRHPGGHLLDLRHHGKAHGAGSHGLGFRWTRLPLWRRRLHSDKVGNDSGQLSQGS